MILCHGIRKWDRNVLGKRFIISQCMELANTMPDVSIPATFDLNTWISFAKPEDIKLSSWVFGEIFGMT